MENLKLIIVAILASILTISIAYTILVFKRFLTWIKTKATRPSKPTLSVSSNVEERIKSLEDEVRELRKYTKVREAGRTAKTKKIVLDYLKELQK